MMYSVKDPFRLDQGDVSFDAPDTVKAAMRRAIDENRTHYLQTTGVPRLLELLADKLRARTAFRSGSPTRSWSRPAASTGCTSSARRCSSRATRSSSRIPEWPPCAGQHPAGARRAGAVPAARIARLALRPRRARVEDHARRRARSTSTRPQPHRRRADARRHRGASRRSPSAHDIWLISDEAYEDVVFDGRARQHRVAARHVRADDLVLHVQQVVRDDRPAARLRRREGRELRERMKKVLFYTASNVASVVQFGGIGALEGSQDCVEAFRDELQARRDLFYAGHPRARRRCVLRRAAAGRLLRVPADRPVVDVAARAGTASRSRGR